MNSIYKSANGQATVQAAYDKLLSQLPADIEQRYVATSQGSTFVLAAGKPDAPPVVFFHGSLSNSITWGWELTRLAPSFRVYAIDMIGEAGKSAAARPNLHSAAYSQWLCELFQALGVAQPILVGLSLGGWLALDYATQFPIAVKGLILISPGGVGRNRNILLWALPYLLLGKWGVKRFYRRVLGPLGDELAGTELSQFLQMISTTSNGAPRPSGIWKAGHIKVIVTQTLVGPLQWLYRCGGRPVSRRSRGERGCRCALGRRRWSRMVAKKSAFLACSFST